MNKYFKLVVAICTVASNFNSFAMLTRVKTDPLSRNFHKNNEMRGYLRQEQARFNERQQFEFQMEQYPPLQYQFHRRLWNGNAKATSICLEKPFEEAMNVYERANDLKKKYPIAGFGEQHYAVLTEDEAATLAQMKK